MAALPVFDLSPRIACQSRTWVRSARGGVKRCVKAVSTVQFVVPAVAQVAGVMAHLEEIKRPKGCFAGDLVNVDKVIVFLLMAFLAVDRILSC